MVTFVRKNLLTISGQFVPPGAAPEPDNSCWPPNDGQPSFLAVASASGSTATVFEVVEGNIFPGALWVGAGYPANTTVVEQLDGEPGSAGQYTLSASGLSIGPENVSGYPAPPATPTQPSSVTCVVSYYAPGTNLWPPNPTPLNWTPPKPLTASFALTLQSDGVTWSGNWDSSVAEGRVDWVIYSAGAVIAAAQGTIFVQANSANVSVS